jgi:hypothetical protein
MFSPQPLQRLPLSIHHAIAQGFGESVVVNLQVDKERVRGWWGVVLLFHLFMDISWELW